MSVSCIDAAKGLSALKTRRPVGHLHVFKRVPYLCQKDKKYTLDSWIIEPKATVLEPFLSLGHCVKSFESNPQVLGSTPSWLHRLIISIFSTSVGSP